MSLTCRFAYAQARVQARFAELPGEGEWQRLAAARTLASFLEEARTGCLRDWVKGLSGDSDTHDMEIVMRALYRETAQEVAGWMPGPWRPAVIWTKWLTLLPLLDHLARGGATPLWLARDRFFRGLLGAGGKLDPDKLADAGAGALLGAQGDLPRAWLTEWHRRWPPCRRAFVREMESLTALLLAHGEDFVHAQAEAGWGLRKALRARLHLLFHRRLLQPAGPFIYLAMAALDLERLRAALVTRALFAGRGEEGGVSSEQGRGAAEMRPSASLAVQRRAALYGGGIG